MDPVTHGLVGAAANLAVAPRATARAAAVAGGLAALSADLDVLVRRADDPLFTLEAHRHATHALPMAPVGALVVAGLLWWGLRRHLEPRSLYLACLLGLATAGLLDACTSYGTHLWWPLSGVRSAWGLVPVVEPLVTLGVAAGVVFAWRRRCATPARLGLSWLLLLLAVGAVQHGRAADAARDLARQRGHEITDLSIKPTMANQLLWSARYLTADSLHAAAVRLPPWGRQVTPGEAAPRLDWRSEYAGLRGRVAFDDIERFERLSEGWLVRHPAHPQVVGDGRYAMLPTSVRPLWGIAVDPARADEHVPFGEYRQMDAAIRQRFVDLLLGRPAPSVSPSVLTDRDG